MFKIRHVFTSVYEYMDTYSPGSAAARYIAARPHLAGSRVSPDASVIYGADGGYYQIIPC